MNFREIDYTKQILKACLTLCFPVEKEEYSFSSICKSTNLTTLAVIGAGRIGQLKSLNSFILMKYLSQIKRYHWVFLVQQL